MKLENYLDYKIIKELSKQSDEDLLKVIKEEFENFYKQTGRYPTTQDIDQSKTIPSSRTLQRRFGGATKVRELLNIPIIDYRKGSTRSKKAKYCLERGLTTEGKVLDILLTRFPLQTIHQQARYGDNNRSDFLVYNKTQDFYIDVFYTENILNFNNILNIKFLKYESIKDKPVYFIVEGLKDEEIQEKMKNKKRYIRENFIFITLDNFKKEINKYKPFQLI